nr:hypothetical protein [Nostoc sp. CreGUA01]
MRNNVFSVVLSFECRVISCPVEYLSYRLTRREVGAPASGDLNFGGGGDAGTRRIVFGK